MKKNIAVLAGGNSSEFVISVKSGKQIQSWVDKKKYNVYLIHLKKNDWHLADKEDVQVDKNDFSITIDGQKIIFDFAYITIHGTPGENGLLEGYLEMMGIPHSTCDTMVSSLTFNKFFCKSYLQAFNIKTAKSIWLKRGMSISNDEVIEKLGLPVFIKPNNGGSSFGTTKVKTPEEIQPAIQAAFAEDNQVIIEEFIKGTEITCGVLKTKEKELILPITEIETTKEFFDYEAKYTPGVTNEITPARISEKIAQACREESSKIYDYLNCSGIVRIDYIVRDNELYFLEINTAPGMSEASIVPQQAAVHGITMTDLLDMVITDILGN